MSKRNSGIADLIKKKLSQKKYIDECLRGNITLEELRSKGVEFVTPL